MGKRKMDSRKALGAILFAGAFLDLVLAEIPRLANQVPSNEIGIAGLSIAQSGVAGATFDIIIGGAGIVLMS
jgi:hypothetical protein